MLRLLLEIPGPGYPADYLLARLRGRRMRTVPEQLRPLGRAGPANDSGFWEQAAMERAWLFRQLNLELRSALAPLFVYFELGTLIQVLRYLAGGRPDAVGRILATSMFAPRIRTLLRGREELAAVLTQLERSLVGEILSLAGIGASFAKGGLQRCEELLRARFLTRVLAGGAQRDLMFFFQAIIDVRNLLTVAKSLRWRPALPPLLLPGGLLVMPRSDRRPCPADLARMVRRWTSGLSLSDEQLRPEHLEPLLQAQQLHQLVCRRRLGGAASACIEYVWRGHVEARERSLRLHTAEEDQS